MKHKVLTVILILCLLLTMTACSSKEERNTYDKAVETFDDGKYAAALKLFEEVPDYKDADNYIKICKYHAAMLVVSPDSSMNKGYSGNVVACTADNADAYTKAVGYLKEADGYADSSKMLRDASEVLDAYNEASRYQRIASTIGDKFLGYLDRCEYDGQTFNVYLSEAYPVTYEVLQRGQTEPKVAETWQTVQEMFTQTIFEYLPNCLVNIIDQNGKTVGTYMRGADNEHATIIFDISQG